MRHPLRIYFHHRYDFAPSLCTHIVTLTPHPGLIPGAGDVADALLNYTLVVRKAKQAEIPDWLLRRMLVNNAISAGMGFVPFIGDVALAAFKANSRNAALLEEFLRIRGEELLKAQNQRTEEPAMVKPGAGAEEGEKIPGKKKSIMGRTV